MSTRISNPSETIVAINGSGGAAVKISASKFAKYVEIQECPPKGYTGSNFAPEGLVYQKPDDNFVASYPLLPGEVLPLGDNTYRGKLGFASPAMTDPANNSIPATVYIQVLSATVTATQVRVREWS
jgi:hypothetical protein